MKKQLSLIKNGSFKKLNLLKLDLKELNYEYQKQYEGLLYYFDIKDNKLSDFDEITRIRYTFEKELFFIKEEFSTLCRIIFNLINEYLHYLNKKEF